MAKYRKEHQTDIMSVYKEEDPTSINERLKKQNDELFAALHKVTAFQESMLKLRECDTIDQTLDIMEAMLDEAIEFSFLRIYMQGNKKTEEMNLVREMCPEDYKVSWKLINWAIEKRELTLIPISETDVEESEDIKSLLILPIIGHSKEIGALLLFVADDTETFTHEQSTLLNMLGRETASVLEQIILRKQVESAKEEMADIVENIPLGVVAIDHEENITLINGTAEFIFNINRNESKGLKISDLFPASSLSKLRETFTTQGADELELKLTEENEETFGISTAPIRLSDNKSFSDDNDECTNDSCGHVIVCRDMKLSREVVRLRELDSMKNDFLSLVSHELRTPLTSIMAYSETLLMEGMVDTEEERKEYLEIIHSEGERLSRLINDVLDLTKMEAGKMDYNYESININNTIKSAKAAVFSLSEAKNMEMILNLADNIPETRADNDKIIQVLTNLYSNSIKFTDEGGTITTETKLHEDEDGTISIDVSVTDTGMGIAPEEIHKVFSKFEMVEKMDHHSVGTGLGMPICQQIIDEGHAGKIWIDSELGVGTTFTFRIPVS